MTEYGEIEFVAEPGGRILDPRVDDLPMPPARGRPPLRERLTPGTLVAAGLLLTALALAVVAPFTRVSTLSERFPSPATFRASTLTLTVDGWGRRHLAVHRIPGLMASAPGPGTRSGIAFLVAGAVVLAVVPLLVLVGRRTAELIAVAGAALAAGAVGVVALDLLEQHQTITPPSRDLHESLAIGPCLWIGALAAACAVAGAVVLVTASGAASVPTAPDPDVPDVEVTPTAV